MTREPTFLFCVGATKAGTSWLHDHLKGHDQCHFRTVKELHYFGLSDPAQFENALRKGRKEIARLTALLAADDSKTASIERRLADLRDWQKVLRARSFDLAAYKAYLTHGMGTAQVVGDVTPGYALLPVETLRSMLETGQDVRVIYLLRDPVARLWSHIRMIVNQNAPVNFKTEAVALFESILNGESSPVVTNIMARGDYASIIAKLTQAFGPKRLLILFYEDLFGADGVAKLSYFLGIRPGTADLNRKVHQGEPLALPTGFRERALAFLRPQYDYIAQNMGHLPKAWQYNMKEGIA